MTGQEKIIALRRSGKSPRTVWVNDFASHTFGGNTVSLTPADVPEQQDWRFVVGLTVVISSENQERMARIAAACAQFAKRVIANLHATGNPQLLQVTDTEGALTWPA